MLIELIDSSRRVQAATGIIIAGVGDQECHFEVDKYALEKSPTIKDWISDPSSLSPSLVKDGALNLSSCDPPVVKFVIDFLTKEGEHNVIRLVKSQVELSYLDESALFYTKVYKLALCLAYAATTVCVHSYETDMHIVSRSYSINVSFKSEH